jgi:hypothetical protein
MKLRAVPMKLRAIVIGAFLSLSLSPIILARPLPVAAATPLYATSALQIARFCPTSYLSSCNPDNEFSQGGVGTKSSSGETSISATGGRIAEAKSYSDLSTGKLGVFAKAQGPTLVDIFGRTRSDTEAFAIAQFTDRVTLQVSPTITGSFTARLHAVVTGSVTGLGPEPDLGFPYPVSANFDIYLAYHDDSGFYCEQFCQHAFPAGHVVRSLHDGSFVLDMDMPIHLHPNVSARIAPTFEMTTIMNAGAQYLGLDTSVGSGVQNAIYEFFNTGALSLQLPAGVTFTSDSGTFLSQVSPPADTVPPTTTASLSPAANANGWNKTAVTVNLTSADDAGGSGVKEISTTLTGAQTGGGVTAGPTTSITITQEGITTVTFLARDNAGNAEAQKTLTIRIDKTAPAIVGSSRPLSNTHGWNNTDVTVHFDCSDALSGVASCASDAVLSSEGANQSVTGTAFDVAGNTASATVGPINIDKSPPVTTAVVNPPSNANGWSRVPVQVTLNASDGFSGLQLTEFNLDGVGLQPYAGPIAVSADGVHHLDFRSTDQAGNVEPTRSLVVNIDRTPPEALIRFDPASRDLAVTGRDSGSGIAEAALLSSVRNTRDDEDRPAAEVRSYRVTDLAGNTLVLTELVENQSGELQGTLRSLTYNGAAVPVQGNESNYRWSLAPEEDDDRSESNRSNPRGSTVRAGTLTLLKQDLQLGEDEAQQSVEANYSARRGITVIRIEQAEREYRIVRQGLALLGLATDAGRLLIDF